jgi:hypothetical protein
MSNNFTAEEIAAIMCALPIFGLWIYSIIESAKAKAFNEGYKRGRASNAYVREIVK